MRPIRSARRFSALALLATLVVLTACGGSGSSDAGGKGPTACLRIGIPAYFDLSAGVTGTGAKPLVSAGSALGFAVLNPASGPGAASDPGYVAAVDRLRGQGKAVVGYVDTDYGRRPAGTVLADVQRWKSWYGVTSIFFDQAPTAKSEFEQYRRYVGAVHASGGKALLNPGAYPARAYLDLADVSVTFEGSYADYRKIRVPAAARSVDARRIWHLVYSTRDSELPAALRSARDRGAGFVYVTDDALPDPWNVVAGYWTAEQTRVLAASGACGRSPWAGS